MSNRCKLSAPEEMLPVGGTANVLGRSNMGMAFAATEPWWRKEGDRKR